MAILNNSNAISTGGYDINNSLRLRRSASAHLSRTPASATNRKTFTWSGWVKRGELGTIAGIAEDIFGIRIDGDNQFRFYFQASDVIDIYSQVSGTIGARLITTAVYRDPSAWYHIVLAIDTTNATAGNRMRLYINGVEVTEFSTDTQPSLNYDTYVNTVNAHYMGYFSAASFDGYMTEINFIDGQALTPSSFGETDTTTGSWKPKAYTGTFGTNGFYLKFSDIATTSGSNAGLGKDFSGNANYWTTNNISVTAGTTYDAMIDSPTLTSATVANYAVMNPLALGTSQTALTQGNLYAIPTSGASNWGTVFSTIAIPTSGKYYIEATAVVYTGSGNNSSLGVVDSATFIPTNTAILYQYTTGEGFDGILCHLFSDYVAPIDDGVQGTNVTGITGTSVNLMLALDVDNGKVYAGYNGTWLNSGNPAAGTGQVATRTFSSTDVVAGQTSYNGSNDQAQYFNFGQRPFSYTPPTGFVRLNTYNLPDSTIKKGNTVMDATLWTGDGNTTRTITNASSFRPDFVWMKERDIAIDHILYDSIRGPSTSGASKALCSNTTVAEGSQNDNSTYGYLDGFASSGFTVTRGSDGATSYTNKNNGTYVAWQWQAGQGSTSSNTSGSITSTVSVNATAGFSVVTYTGTGANATVGHGLGVAPKMIIAKVRSTTNDWPVYHAGFATPATSTIFLNLTNAVNASSTTWNSTAPTSSVFSIGTTGVINASTQTYVAYCWAEIAGFSKFGSYTGNGSADGPFVYLGFRPKFIMWKETSTSSFDWNTYDSVRNTYNIVSLRLNPSTSNAEFDASANFPFDFLSNGFKIRGTNGNANSNGNLYIYAAYAENPFKNANAR